MAGIPFFATINSVVLVYLLFLLVAVQSWLIIQKICFFAAFLFHSSQDRSAHKAVSWNLLSVPSDSDFSVHVHETACMLYLSLPMLLSVKSLIFYFPSVSSSIRSWCTSNFYLISFNSHHNRFSLWNIYWLQVLTISKQFFWDLISRIWIYSLYRSNYFPVFFFCSYNCISAAPIINIVSKCTISLTICLTIKLYSRKRFSSNILFPNPKIKNLYTFNIQKCWMYKGLFFKHSPGSPVPVRWSVGRSCPQF